MESVLTLQDFGFVIVISKRINLFWGIYCFYTLLSHESFCSHALYAGSTNF